MLGDVGEAAAAVVVQEQRVPVHRRHGDVRVAVQVVVGDSELERVLVPLRYSDLPVVLKWKVGQAELARHFAHEWACGTPNGVGLRPPGGDDRLCPDRRVVREPQFDDVERLDLDRGAVFRSSPRAKRGRNRLRCSSVPNRSTAAAMIRCELKMPDTAIQTADTRSTIFA